MEALNGEAVVAFADAARWESLLADHHGRKGGVWVKIAKKGSGGAAVVVDSGAIGSHAAIVAREYGIPAVMGTVEGTQKLMDGQLVTVDGSAGTVATQPLADGFPSDVTMPGESSGSPFPAHGPS